MENELITRSLRGLLASGIGTAAKLSADEFAPIWGRLCAAYPRAETSALTIEVYYERLSGYSADDVREAIGDCLDECKFFPSIAEIIARIETPRGCTHTVKLAEIRSREQMLRECEKQSTERLQSLAKQVADLETREQDYYRRQREYIDAVELPQAEKKLKETNDKILEQERILKILRSKVKLLDQARILQSDDMPEQ